MIFTVAVVTVAAGTIAEFQFWVAYVSATADCTFVGVVLLRLGSGSSLGISLREGDNFGTVLLVGVALVLAEALHSDAPGCGKNIEHISSKEQKIVRKGDHGEEIHGEGIHQQTVDDKKQIKQREDPRFDGNDEKQQELRVGEHGSIAEEQTQVQVSDICTTAEKHAPDVHQHDAAQIKQIES